MPGTKEFPLARPPSASLRQTSGPRLNTKPSRLSRRPGPHTATQETARVPPSIEVEWIFENKHKTDALENEANRLSTPSSNPAQSQSREPESLENIATRREQLLKHYS